MTEPHWPNVSYAPIDYQAQTYYSAPKSVKPLQSLDEVDPELLKTYAKLGISLTEQKRLTGVAVDAIQVMSPTEIKKLADDASARCKLAFHVTGCASLKAAIASDVQNNSPGSDATKAVLIEMLRFEFDDIISNDGGKKSEYAVATSTL
jgi:Fe-S cluster assembly scaffold protein SufB